MLKRVLGLVGWLGVALVGAALAISQLKPAAKATAKAVEALKP